MIYAYYADLNKIPVLKLAVYTFFVIGGFFLKFGCVSLETCFFFLLKNHKWILSSYLVGDFLRRVVNLRIVVVFRGLYQNG